MIRQKTKSKIYKEYWDGKKIKNISQQTAIPTPTIRRILRQHLQTKEIWQDLYDEYNKKRITLTTQDYEDIRSHIKMEKTHVVKKVKTPQ